MKTIRLPRTRLNANDRKQEFAPHVILVPIDFSPLSKAALERAKQIAKQFGSKIRLVHAVEPIIHPFEYAIVSKEMDQVNEQQLNERETRIQALKEALDEEGYHSRAEVRSGKPWHVVVDLARRAKADLIVIATHGHTGPKHLLLGSTTERVVQHAPCSVLVVR